MSKQKHNLVASSLHDDSGKLLVCCLQATIPEGGARLIMASGPFWDVVTPSQDINNVRKHTAKKAPVKLQAGAVKQGLKVEPTVFVVDLAPATSAAGLVDQQKLCKQVGPACCSLVVLVKKRKKQRLHLLVSSQ